MSMAKKVTVEPKKTSKELEQERKVLIDNLKQNLLILGAEYSMLDMIIEDLKSQMVSHGSEIINNMIADLINLENKIARVKEEEATMLGDQREIYW